jgi:hypothetical protein
MFEVPIMKPDTGSVVLAVMLLMQEAAGAPQATAVVNPDELIVAIPVSLDAHVTASVMSAVVGAAV